MRLGATPLVCAALAAGLAAFAVGDTPAYAVTPQEVLADKALEKRARDISAELRCLVCQNQSIDDSDAPLAHDLRVLVRERLTAGDTDQQVRAFIVDRYGEFVLLKPPFSAATLLLWLMPLLALAGAALILWNAFGAPRKPATAAAPANKLSADEQAALDALLRDEQRDRS
ncbi:cytochrome c-type biogenesis protein CcmH [Hyphomicrobium sp.]|uniref:cytochrome c-type biogenesis protein n=1 Tax=Hyphomicrobium sp. TaxID=82 RepID=UPI0025C1F5D3|nr:cytochrome c-type biogenesis protein CcmH [Hyphomicrobium sp.]MCC7251019.1 cytochrome c-type biogenesis protein CcmH [Hyphomicrobium sp.]